MTDTSANVADQTQTIYYPIKSSTKIKLMVLTVSALLRGLEAVRVRPGIHWRYRRCWVCIIWCLKWWITPLMKLWRSTVIKLTSSSEDESVSVKEQWTRYTCRYSPRRRVSAAQVIADSPAWGGKFDDNNGYKVSGGLHGVCVCQWLMRYQKGRCSISGVMATL